MCSSDLSGKLPGRVVEFFAHEGDTVHAGDTLVRIHSALFEAQLTQALAMQDVARQQNRKVDSGTRKQIKQSAYDLWQQAIFPSPINALIRGNITPVNAENSARIIVNSLVDVV